MLKVLLTAALLLSISTPAIAAEKKGASAELALTDRAISLNGRLTVSAAQKYSNYLIRYDAATKAPIFLLITSSSGSAQGVMLLADTIRAIKSPVVAVVMTDLFGAGAAAAVMSDRLIMYRSATLHFTELPYEGVRKPGKRRLKKRKPSLPSASTIFMQAVRSRYLTNFWSVIGRRIGMKGPALAGVIKKGGLSLSAKDAVKKKIAYSIPQRITYTRLADESREVKVTTTRRQIRTLKPKK